MGLRFLYGNKLETSGDKAKVDELVNKFQIEIEDAPKRKGLPVAVAVPEPAPAPFIVRECEIRLAGLQEDQVLFLGREPAAPDGTVKQPIYVTVPNDDPAFPITLSRQHLSFEKNGGVIEVTDHDSANGAAVVRNGAVMGLTTKVPFQLQDGDMLVVFGTQGETMNIFFGPRSGASPQQLAGLKSDTRPLEERAADMLGKLEPGEKIKVGSRPVDSRVGEFNDLVCNDSRTSRQHAEITLESVLPGGRREYRIVDRGSVNGTFLNGVKEMDFRASSGDSVSFGTLGGATISLP
jgi:pSer/pThr/pTyr-binding forkhead associated (FHA) protein